MSVGIPKVDLRRGHPTDHARLARGIPTERLRFDAVFVQRDYGMLQIFEFNRECQVSLTEGSVLPAITRAGAPQAKHSLLLFINPQKNDVARWVTIGERQSHHLPVEGLRDLRIRDGDVSFVEVHTSK